MAEEKSFWKKLLEKLTDKEFRHEAYTFILVMLVLGLVVWFYIYTAVEFNKQIKNETQKEKISYPKKIGIKNVTITDGGVVRKIGVS